MTNLVTWRRIRYTLAVVFWLAVLYEVTWVMGHHYIAMLQYYRIPEVLT